MREPLGLDPETWKHRNETNSKTFGKHKSYKRGVEAGKKGEPVTANPYTLTEEMWKILRSRAYWELGREHGAFTPSSKQLKKEKKARHEEHKRLKKLKERVKKHKHKHHHD
jgi:hypothetical protein